MGTNLPMGVRTLLFAALLAAACGKNTARLVTGQDTTSVAQTSTAEAAAAQPSSENALPTAHEVRHAWADFASLYNEPDAGQRGDLAGLLAITDAVVLGRADTIRPFYAIPMPRGEDPARTSTLTLEVETVVAGTLVHQQRGTVQVTITAGFLADPIPPRDMGQQRVVALLQDREAQSRVGRFERPERYAGQYGLTSGQGLFVASADGVVPPLWQGAPVDGAAVSSVDQLVDSIQETLPADFHRPVDLRASPAPPELD